MQYMRGVCWAFEVLQQQLKWFPATHRIGRGPACTPIHHFVAVAGVADAYLQPVEPAVLGFMCVHCASYLRVCMPVLVDQHLVTG